MFLRQIIRNISFYKSNNTEFTLSSSLLNQITILPRYQSNLKISSYTEENAISGPDINYLINVPYPKKFLEQVESFEVYSRKPLIQKFLGTDLEKTKKAYENYIRMKFNTFNTYSDDNGNPSRMI